MLFRSRTARKLLAVSYNQSKQSKHGFHGVSSKTIERVLTARSALLDAATAIANTDHVPTAVRIAALTVCVEQRTVPALSVIRSFNEKSKLLNAAAVATSTSATTSSKNTELLRSSLQRAVRVLCLLSKSSANKDDDSSVVAAAAAVNDMLRELVESTAVDCASALESLISVRNDEARRASLEAAAAAVAASQHEVVVARCDGDVVDEALNHHAADSLEHEQTLYSDRKSVV